MPKSSFVDFKAVKSAIIGASGTGKSTLLFNLIRQDIENGEGVALLDPHGDLTERILGIIPPERINDVVLVDPADEEFSVGFNILSAHSEQEKTLLASDLVSVFQRLSTSWGDQMQSVLQNAILAFLNSSRGGTLADLRRFLVEPAFRTEFLKSVSDPNVLYYWQKGFSHLSGNKSVGPILTRLEMFLAQRPIAHMVSQPENKLNFGEIMDTGKIFLAMLPEGLLGRENSYLLGAVLVSKFQQLVMARQAKKIAARRNFWIYIDEFANFITPTMAEILSGARKYANIDGATGSSYVQSTSGPTNIGYYQVIASNSQGSITNTPVGLIFLSIKTYVGLDILSPPGIGLAIKSSPALNATNQVTVTNVTPTSEPYIYIDYGSPTNATQFYQVIPE